MPAAVTPSIPNRTGRRREAEQWFEIHIPKMQLHISHSNFAPSKRQVRREELDYLLQIIPRLSLHTWVFPSFPKELYLAVADVEMLLSRTRNF